MSVAPVVEPATLSAMQIIPSKTVPASDLRPGMTANIEDRYILVKHVTLGEDVVKVAGPPRGHPDSRQRVIDLDPEAKVTIDAPEDVRLAMLAMIRDALVAAGPTAGPAFSVKASPIDGPVVVTSKDGWKVEIA
jgi:hypothetical protein